MDIGRLTKVDATTWRIEPHGAMRVPAIIYADESLLRDIDDKVYEQAANVATLPGIIGASYAMPDAHWGYGFPIGGVAAFDPEAGGVVSVGGVGFDISCGVRTMLTGLRFTMFVTCRPATLSEPAFFLSEGMCRSSHALLTVARPRDLIFRRVHPLGSMRQAIVLQSGGSSSRSRSKSGSPDRSKMMARQRSRKRTAAAKSLPSGKSGSPICTEMRPRSWEPLIAPQDHAGAADRHRHHRNPGLSSGQESPQSKCQQPWHS